MATLGGWNGDRHEHGYFDVEAVYLPCSILVLDQNIYDVLAGNTPAIVEYYADVTVGGVALLNIDEIFIERAIENVSGTCHIGFHTLASPMASLVAGAEVIVTAGIRFAGVTASQKRFHGKLDSVTYPTLGRTRGYLDCYDNGKTLQDAAVGVTTLIGDALFWLADRCAALDLGDGFRMTIRTDGIELVNSHLMSYTSLSEAMKAVINAFKKHYAFFTGMNELVILDPSILANESPLFTLLPAGVLKLQDTEDGSDRVNRIPYSNYTGYSKNFVTYQVNVGADGAGTVSAVSIEGTGFIAGVYNDTADQVAYPILTLEGGVQNNICATDAELQAYCASVAEESQRSRVNLDIGYNPLIDLGTVLKYGSGNYFISRIKDRIQAGKMWETQMEIRKI